MRRAPGIVCRQRRRRRRAAPERAARAGAQARRARDDVCGGRRGVAGGRVGRVGVGGALLPLRRGDDGRGRRAGLARCGRLVRRNAVGHAPGPRGGRAQAPAQRQHVQLQGQPHLARDPQRGARAAADAAQLDGAERGEDVVRVRVLGRRLRRRQAAGVDRQGQGAPHRPGARRGVPGGRRLRGRRHPDHREAYEERGVRVLWLRHGLSRRDALPAGGRGGRARARGEGPRLHRVLLEPADGRGQGVRRRVDARRLCRRRAPLERRSQRPQGGCRDARLRQAHVRPQADLRGEHAVRAHGPPRRHLHGRAAAGRGRGGRGRCRTRVGALMGCDESLGPRGGCGARARAKREVRVPSSPLL
mmetsp:Transcript_1838/g.5814  ORF Transcript_1838/g.5814 Transcript_1838/m.5814 type:complete len:360 (+) Transcript_1838:1487-2566(+)